MELKSLKKFIVVLVALAFVFFAEVVAHSDTLVIAGISALIVILIVFAVQKKFATESSKVVEDEITVDLSDRSLVGKHYSLVKGKDFITDVQKLIIREELLESFKEEQNCSYSFYTMIPLEEKTPTISIYEGEKCAVQYYLENNENEDFSDKLLCVRGKFICRDGITKLMSEGVVVLNREVDIDLAFNSLDTIIYRFEYHFINAEDEKTREAVERITGKDLEAKGLKHGHHITPANVRCVGVCRSCGKSFVFNTFNYKMRGAEPVYSDDGLLTAMLHTAPVDKRNWRITLNGITYRYYNNFCCPHCGEAYIDYKQNNELKHFGNLGCVHFGKPEADITALSELYNEHKY